MTRKVAIISPFPPTRGGIARHSGEVAQAFEAMDGIELRRITFSRLFPKLLYPGEMDESAAAKTGDLDTLNPLTWRKVARDLAAWKPDILVIPAWTFFVAPVMGWIAAQARKAGIRVAMIVHNVADHEGKAWKNALTRYQLSQADSFITHSPHLRDQLQEVFPDTPTVIAAHPAYGDFPDNGENWPRRAAIELLFFGYVREYKGLDVLLDALEELPQADVKLTIAGEVWAGGDTIRSRISSSALADKVELLDRYIDDEEVAPAFRRCDALVVPYRNATGSGVIAVAHNFGTRVIASDIAGLREAVSTEAGDMLFPAGDASALATAISALADAPEADATRRKALPTWRAYAVALLENAGLKT